MTDQQLKALFPKLLPGKYRIVEGILLRIIDDWNLIKVKDTELLSLCREIEEMFTDSEKKEYGRRLWMIIIKYLAPSVIFVNLDHCYNVAHASWEARILAAAEVKLSKILPIFGEEGDDQGL